MSQGVGTDRCGLRATGTLLSAACAFDLGHVSIVIITLVVALLAESTSGCAWQASSSPRARGAEHLCNQLGPDEAHLPSLEVGLGVRVGLAREVGLDIGLGLGLGLPGKVAALLLLPRSRTPRGTCCTPPRWLAFRLGLGLGAKG